MILVVLMFVLCGASLLVSIQSIGDAMSIKRRSRFTHAAQCHFFVAHKHSDTNATEHISCVHPRGLDINSLDRPLSCYENCKVSLPKQSGISHQEAVRYSSLRHLIAIEILRSVAVVVPTVIALQRTIGV